MVAARASNGRRVVILDNYDSFAYNLYQYIGSICGVEPRVFRNDCITLNELRMLRPTHIVISPGPGTPENPAYFGVCRAAIADLGKTVPTLGVCLGHQGIGAVFGGRVVRAPVPMHGKESAVVHDGSSVFRDCPSPMNVMRYHSLMVDPTSLPSCLRVTARTADGIIMGFEHAELPIVGVQFHPESVGTPHGLRIISNFLTWGDARTVA